MPKQPIERHQHPRHPKLWLWLRPKQSKNWLAYTFIERNRYQSTGTDDFKKACRLAASWYLGELKAGIALKRQHPIDQLIGDPTVAEVYASYLADLKPHKKPYAEQKWGPIGDFWKSLELGEITVQTFDQFIKDRRKKVCDHTIHKDITLIRQILKYAMDKGRLAAMPHIPRLGTIEKNPRPWFTKSEWRHLMVVSKKRILEAPNARTKQQREDLHDLLLFMLASKVRVDEVYGIRFSACAVKKNPHGERFLESEVSGKKGLRPVTATQDAASVYEKRLAAVKAAGGDESQLIFPEDKRDAFRELLIAAGLLTLTEKGKVFRRNLKSVRCTAISFQLIDFPEVNLQIVADNAGTSPQMIHDFYAKRLTA